MARRAGPGTNHLRRRLKRRSQIHYLQLGEITASWMMRPLCPLRAGGDAQSRMSGLCWRVAFECEQLAQFLYSGSSLVWIVVDQLLHD